MDRSRRQLLTGAAGASALAALPIEALAQAAPATPPGTVSNDAVKAEKVPAMEWHSERPLTGSFLRE